MELTLATLKDKRLKRLHLLKNRSWIQDDDIRAALAECEQPTTDAAVSAVSEALGLKKFGDSRYTTPEIYHAERAALMTAIARKNERAHTINPDTLNRVFAKYATAKSEQKNAVSHISDSGGVCVIEGAAGAGKSFTMGMASEALADDGYSVIGVAPSGSAAMELGNAANIPSKTAFAFYSDYVNGRLSIGPKSVIIFDEAGMADSVTLGRILNVAHQKGSKVVLLGDRNQLEAVSTASLYAEIGDEIGFAEMTDIARQIDPAKQQISKDFYAGEGSKALKQMQALGMIQELGHDQLISSLASDYIDSVQSGKSALALASRNKDVRALNNEIKQQMIDRGLLNPDTAHQVELTGPSGLTEFDTLYQGEKVMLRMSNKDMGLVNGDTGTIESFGDSKMVIAIDREDGPGSVEIDLAEYSHIQPAYAMTVHKSQGATVDRALCLPNVGMADSRSLYVAATRAREGTDLYIEEGQLGLFEEAADKREAKLSTLSQYTQGEKLDMQTQAEQASNYSHSLMPAPTSKDEHFQELLASTDYNRLQSMAREEVSQDEEAILGMIGVQTQAPGRDYVPSRNAEMGIMQPPEKQKPLFGNHFENSYNKPTDEPYRIDRSDLSQYIHTKRADRESAKAVEKGLLDQGYRQYAQIHQYHKTQITARLDAARAYQRGVDSVYAAAGFSNNSQRSSAQASYAAEKLRGKASLLGQNRRDYMIALQPPKANDNWFGASQRMKAFRAQQAERLNRGTPEAMLEYKHAKMINDFGNRAVIESHRGTLNPSYLKGDWASIEATIERDRQALMDLASSNNPHVMQSFEATTGVSLSSGQEARLKSEMSWSELLELKQEERAEQRRQQENEELKRIAEAEHAAEAYRNQDSDKSEEKDQVGGASTQVDQSEQEQLEQEAREEAQRNDQVRAEEEALEEERVILEEQAEASRESLKAREEEEAQAEQEQLEADEEQEIQEESEAQEEVEAQEEQEELEQAEPEDLEQSDQEESEQAQRDLDEARKEQEEIEQQMLDQAEQEQADREVQEQQSQDEQAIAEDLDRIEKEEEARQEQEETQESEQSIEDEDQVQEVLEGNEHQQDLENLEQAEQQAEEERQREEAAQLIEEFERESEGLERDQQEAEISEEEIAELERQTQEQDREEMSEEEYQDYEARLEDQARAREEEAREADPENHEQNRQAQAEQQAREIEEIESQMDEERTQEEERERQAEERRRQEEQEISR